MRRLSTVMFALLVVTLVRPAIASDLTGSGSTFAFPIMARWADAFQRATGVHVLYEPIGSAAGVNEIKARVVDFGVTDAPLVDAQLLRDGLIQFPLVIGGIVPVVNLEGVAPGQLHLTGEVLANIYLGKMRRWDDPSIAALNPGLKLPSIPILVVYRSDGSGTTFNFTDYLSKASLPFRAAVGSDTTVNWPVGVGAKGNGGVATAVGRVKGAIGYLEFGYAAKSNIAYVLVRNRAGSYVAPSEASFQAAVTGVDWMREPDFHIIVTDAAPADAYPIVATSFVLLRAYPKDRPQAEVVLRFFQWALDQGQDLARQAGYLPLPAPLVELVKAHWSGENRRT
jgi:phosphate transport system substrate-binding protein